MVPPGEATAFISSSAVRSLWSIILAVPSIVPRTNFSAFSLVKPWATPSFIISLAKRIKKAGELPEIPVTASICSSGRIAVTPDAPKIFSTNSTCFCSTPSPTEMAVAPAEYISGVLGITRIIFLFPPRARFIFSILTPATGEIMRTSDERCGFNSSKTEKTI